VCPRPAGRARGRSTSNANNADEHHQHQEPHDARLYPLKRPEAGKIAAPSPTGHASIRSEGRAGGPSIALKGTRDREMPTSCCLSRAMLPTLLAVIANNDCSGRIAVDGGHERTAPTSDGFSDGPKDYSCPSGEPFSTRPCYSCAPLSPGLDAGCAGTSAVGLSGRDGGSLPSDSRYPLGGTVTLPVENPGQPGQPQTCVCRQDFPDAAVVWGCGI
jgi:hypothetical protein